MTAGFVNWRAKAFASLACLLALAGAAAPAGAQCDPTPSLIDLCGAPGYPGATWYSYDPAYSQSRLCGPICNFEGCENPVLVSASFDHEAGTLNATVVGRYNNEVGRALVRLNDFYRLEGPPSGNPVGVRVRLAVAVTGCYVTRGDYELLVGYPTSGETRTYGDFYGTDCLHEPSSALADTIVLEKAVMVGEQFVVLASVSVLHGQPGVAAISGTLTFTGLPPGYQIRSCKGYGPPVPALSSSWGALKLRYR